MRLENPAGGDALGSPAVNAEGMRVLHRLRGRKRRVRPAGCPSDEFVLLAQVRGIRQLRASSGDHVVGGLENGAVIPDAILDGLAEIERGRRSRRVSQASQADAIVERCRVWLARSGPGFFVENAALSYSMYCAVDMQA